MQFYGLFPLYWDMMIGLENLLYKFGSKLIRLKGDFSFEEFIDI